jgi:hypothetical protein
VYRVIITNLTPKGQASGLTLGELSHAGNCRCWGLNFVANFVENPSRSWDTKIDKVCAKVYDKVHGQMQTNAVEMSKPQLEVSDPADKLDVMTPYSTFCISRFV